MHTIVLSEKDVAVRQRAKASLEAVTNKNLHSESRIYRLKNALAADVASIISDYLEKPPCNLRRVSLWEMQASNILLTPEPITNSLIVNTPPEFVKDLERMIEMIDKMPPQVMIQRR